MSEKLRRFIMIKPYPEAIEDWDGEGPPIVEYNGGDYCSVKLNSRMKWLCHFKPQDWPEFFKEIE